MRHLARPVPPIGDPKLVDGSRVAVIGGGPAGSFFSYFLLAMAERAGLALGVDIYEPRDFRRPGPQGCNMCGGIVSETLVQNLALEGICIPPSVIQRGIDSYVLHLDAGSARIDLPLQEMRIGAVHRGAGPRDLGEQAWQGFDQFLLDRALARGASLVPARVDQLEWQDGRPRLRVGEAAQCYDLAAIALGVNSSTLKLLEQFADGYRRPTITKTLIREYRLGERTVGDRLGTSMHVFLLDLPRLEFAAVIPKGDYVTMCLLGEGIDTALGDAFATTPSVRALMPVDWQASQRSCQCLPHINIKGVDQPYADRLLFIGDCGVTRLYKDGIGAAYRTAKSAARAAVFGGLSAAAFRRQYWPVCRTIAADNRLGRLTFRLTEGIRQSRLLQRAILRMVQAEQRRPGSARRLSGILWDLFSGSASYRDIAGRMLHPGFVGRLVWSVVASVGAAGGGRPVREGS